MTVRLLFIITYNDTYTRVEVKVFAWRKLNFHLILQLFRILYSWLVKMSNYSAIVENIHLKHAFFTFIFVLKSRINIAKDTMNTIQILFLINMHLFIGLLLHILPPTSIIYILTKWKYLIISKLVWKYSNFKILIPSFNFLFWHFLTVNLLAISGIKLIPIINWS